MRVQGETTQMSASIFYEFYRPSRCELRPWLIAHAATAAPPGPFEQVLFRLGQRHEASHLAELGPHTDLRGGSIAQRAERTLAAIGLGDRVLYQPAFVSTAELNGDKVELVGVPDFLIRDGDGYRVRDAKLSLHADEMAHPEIPLQIQLYGYLLRRATGEPPRALEALLGDSTLVEIPSDGGTGALSLLGGIRRTATQSAKPYAPVGWSKCQGCGFRCVCWAAAEAARDVALVYGVDQGLARALHDMGVTTFDELGARFSEDALAEVVRPWGEGVRRVGKSAGQILAQARAMTEGREIRLGRPRIPSFHNYVMFDLEGMPPHLSELDKVYLWGTQVCGQNPGPYQAALAGFGTDGDRQAWSDFLRQAGAIFDVHGDIPFVHWHHYETTKLKGYIERYGNPDGIAVRILGNCLDLLPITRRAVVLAEPSYSLKIVERRAGYQRKLEEYGGDWSMARFIEATETQDEAERQAIMDEIVAYNREDLEATWAVLCWLHHR
jgi:uncharacterized protein